MDPMSPATMDPAKALTPRWYFSASQRGCYLQNTSHKNKKQCKLSPSPQAGHQMITCRPTDSSNLGGRLQQGAGEASSALVQPGLRSNILAGGCSPARSTHQHHRKQDLFLPEGNRLAPPPLPQLPSAAWLGNGTERWKGPRTQPPPAPCHLLRFAGSLSRGTDRLATERPAAPSTVCGCCITSSTQSEHPLVLLPLCSLMPSGLAPSLQPASALHATWQLADLGLDYLTAYATVQNWVFEEWCYTPAVKFNL